MRWAFVIACGCSSAARPAPVAQLPVAQPTSAGGTTYGGASSGGPTIAPPVSSDDLGDTSSYGVSVADLPVGLDPSLGSSLGPHDGRGRRQPRTEAPRVVIPHATSVSFGLDPAIVRRYMKRNAMHFETCYDQQLQTAPGLRGTVVAHFTIGLDGHVTSSTATGMPMIEDCVAVIIRLVEFPKPQASPVDVEYPLTFEPEAISN